METGVSYHRIARRSVGLGLLRHSHRLRQMPLGVVFQSSCHWNRLIDALGCRFLAAPQGGGCGGHGHSAGGAVVCVIWHCGRRFVCLRSSRCQYPHVRDHGAPSLGGGRVSLSSIWGWRSVGLAGGCLGGAWGFRVGGGGVEEEGSLGGVGGAGPWAARRSCADPARPRPAVTGLGLQAGAAGATVSVFARERTSRIRLRCTTFRHAHSLHHAHPFSPSAASK